MRTIGCVCESDDTCPDACVCLLCHEILDDFVEEETGGEMTTFEGNVSTISATGSDKDVLGYVVDRQDDFRAAIGRPIDIYLPTINGEVRGLARILRVDGTEARVEFTVDELGPAQLGDIFGDDWRKPTIRMFGAAVRDVVFGPAKTGNTQLGKPE